MILLEPQKDILFEIRSKRVQMFGSIFFRGRKEFMNIHCVLLRLDNISWTNQAGQQKFD